MLIFAFRYRTKDFNLETRKEEKLTQTHAAQGIF